MFKSNNLPKGLTTPNVFRSEGKSPAQHLVAASYLPLLRLDAKANEYKVILTGKVLAIDSKNQIVPAGYAIDVETAIKDGSFANCVNKYSAVDVENGVRNFAGDLAAEGEAVVKSFFTAGDAAQALINEISVPQGMAQYDIWRQNGAGFDGNPVDYTFQNFNLQQGAALLTRYFIELPVVANTSGVLLKGMTVFEGAAKHGLVTFNANSNFVMYSGVSEAAADVASLAKEINSKAGKIIGKVLFIYTQFPKDYLQYVRTYSVDVQGQNALYKPAGTATLGLPDNLTFAGVSDPASAKIVRINVFI